MTIRFATPADAPGLLAIYAPYITGSVITFEYDVPSVSAFAARIQTVQQQLPCIVAESDGQLVGYAYASMFHTRTAYQWSVETSVYIHSNWHRRGIARQLYEVVFDRLRRQGYCNAYAGMTVPNAGSEALHRSLGFERIGVFANAGYKFDAWHSVAWYQLTLQPHPPIPAKPVPITDLA